MLINCIKIYKNMVKLRDIMFLTLICFKIDVIHKIKAFRVF